MKRLADFYKSVDLNSGSKFHHIFFPIPWMSRSLSSIFIMPKIGDPISFSVHTVTSNWLVFNSAVDIKYSNVASNVGLLKNKKKHEVIVKNYLKTVSPHGDNSSFY